MMNKKILFFDIDGTILHVPGGQPNPSAELKEAIKTLRANGHLCFIATGRTFAYLNTNVLDLAFDGFVTCNGAVVLKDDEILFSNFFTKELSQEIVDMMDRYHNSYTILGSKKVYAKKEFEDIYKTFKLFNVPMQNVVSEYSVSNLDIAKFEISAHTKEVADYIRSLKDRGCEIIEFYGSDYFEFTMPNATKGKAIQQLLKVLDVPVEDSIAFGDGDNDIEMFDVVGYAVAMGNGSEKAKAASDKVTETCKENGIVNELKRMGLI